MKEKVYYDELYMIYKNLLTEKQRDYYEAYNLNDLSLAEVADNMQVSRNAVHNMINIVIDALNKYENKLKLYHKRNKIIEILQEEDIKKELKEKIISLL